ncbi:MAG TPA: ATP-binding protein, partial [Gammaproteobacteria bacterium]|nr:ATP-binding protein [Gammaproteobacteria bacterium]
MTGNVTILWSMIAAFGLMLGVWHSLVFVLDRRAYANLAFATVALGAMGIAWTELGMMTAASAAEWGRWVRWYQVPNFFLIVGTVAFVRLYFGTGRQWLLWSLVALRALILLVDFVVDPNFNFERIDGIARTELFGQQISVVGHAVAAPRQSIATLATVLSVLFIVDAAASLWRTGSAEARRRAVVIGGSIALFFAVAILNTQLVIWGLVMLPTLTAPSFLITLAAMAFEMSRDTLRASRLARELRQNQRALELAASAAGLGLWSWDSETRSIWATGRARAMFGLRDSGPIDLEALAASIPTEDAARLRETAGTAAATGSEQEVEFRVVTAEGSTRWLRARGRWESASGKRTLIRSVLRDVTEERRVHEEIEELRRDLAHASRVTALGQLASAIAHELRQPLGAIRGNVQAAQMLLQGPEPDLQELRDILGDIHRDDSRAAQVIDRLAALLKRRPIDLQPVALEGLLQDVISLVRSDALARGVRIETKVDSLVAHADKVHVSQVLINLIINAMDAMTDTAAACRRITVHARAAESGLIEIAVSDCGPGVPAEALTRVFEPFFTTKASGMGMGLCVSRTIIEAHGGRLWVESGADGGATFR